MLLNRDSEKIANPGQGGQRCDGAKRRRAGGRRTSAARQLQHRRGVTDTTSGIGVCSRFLWISRYCQKRVDQCGGAPVFGFST